MRSMRVAASFALFQALLTSLVGAVLYPHDIQGSAFLSPLAGTKVKAVQGIVTAKVSTGCYIQTPTSAWDSIPETSEGLFLFGSTVCRPYAINDWIQVGNATVSEYRAFASNLKTTELSGISGVTLIRANASDQVNSTVIGKDRIPPHQYIGIEDPFALPANTTNLETGSRSKMLNVTSFSADFWESLESMLVTLPSPTVLGSLTSFNETYLLPAGLKSPSLNSRGGLTLAAYDTADPNQRWDANGQAIQLAEPLDGSFAPADLVMGDILEDTTGIISYDFGLYIFLPLTAPKVKTNKSGGPLRSPFYSTGGCGNLVAGTFNLENLPSTDMARINRIGGQIDYFLRNPDVMVLNEIQDDDGATDDGVVTANKTLTSLIGSIKGAKYAFTDIDPVNDQDGGEPGGNIRPAIIYRTDRMSLTRGIPVGNSTQAVDVVKVRGQAQLTLNPGRIDPTNDAWKSSRKPIVAQFQLLGSLSPLFVIGAHLTSKGGSTTPYGPPQAPINGGVEQRIQQATVIRDFVQHLLSVDRNAKVVLMGDFNEFSQVQPLATLVGGDQSVLQEILINPRVERYTYVFQQNSQQIDHIFTTPAIARGIVSAFVPHVNTWTTDANATSDHDPIVARMFVC